MLARFRTRNRNREIVDDLYAEIVERSRRPVLFTRHGLPDTVMGRFESLSIHVFLFLARCRDDREVKPLAQDLVDRFVTDVEDSIREIGIGDIAVPKRMRKLAGMFYERVAAYDPPLSASDAPGLAAVLAKHALPKGAAADEAMGLAEYMMDSNSELARTPTADILAGRLVQKV